MPHCHLYPSEKMEEQSEVLLTLFEWCLYGNCVCTVLHMVELVVNVLYYLVASHKEHRHILNIRWDSTVFESTYCISLILCWLNHVNESKNYLRHFGSRFVKEQTRIFQVHKLFVRIWSPTPRFKANDVFMSKDNTILNSWRLEVCFKSSNFDILGAKFAI